MITSMTKMEFTIILLVYDFLDEQDIHLIEGSSRQGHEILILHVYVWGSLEKSVSRRRFFHRT